MFGYLARDVKGQLKEINIWNGRSGTKIRKFLVAKKKLLWADIFPKELSALLINFDFTRPVSAC